MIDSKLRHSLRSDVRRLLLDRVEVGEFDDAFFFRYTSTDDEGVREVASLCYSLYSDTETERTHYRIASSGMRSTFARAFLFLRSDLEYEWQRDPVIPDRMLVCGIATFMMLPVLMAIAFFSLPLSVTTGQVFIILSALVASVGMLLAVYLICRRPSSIRTRSQPCSGDYEVWPFFRESDLQRFARD